MAITIVSRYRTENIYEPIEDYFDEVERGGYVSPDKKIQSFLQTGSVPTTSGGSDFELQSEEVDMESSSDEYIELLHNEAESFDEEVMPQFIDKLSAVEVLDKADKKLDALAHMPKPEPDNSEKVLKTLKNIETELKSKKTEEE